MKFDPEALNIPILLKEEAQFLFIRPARYHLVDCPHCKNHIVLPLNWQPCRTLLQCRICCKRFVIDENREPTIR